MPGEKKPDSKDKSDILVNGVKYGGGAMLLAVAIRALRNHEAAEDAVQETYIKALRGLERFRGESEITTWLYPALKNVIADMHRRKATRPKEVAFDNSLLEAEPDLSVGPEDYVLNKERREQILGMIKRLPEQYQPDVLMYMHGYGQTEIAKLLDKPLGTVKNNIHRAELLLKEMLERGEVS